MDVKPHPNQREYILALRRMTPGQRAKTAMEMSDLGRRLLRQALRKRFPELPEEAIHQLYLDRLTKCHNKNY
jgi:hypothetical protein